MEMMTDPHEHRASAGFGFRDAPQEELRCDPLPKCTTRWPVC